MFRRIVVGADGSPEGRDAVALGAAIAEVTGSGLTLLGAFSPLPVSIGEEMDRRSQARTIERQLWMDRRRLAPSAHVEVVPDANPARALLTEAERWHADLVVIGSGRGAMDGRCRIGSTGRGLLHRMPPALAIATRGLHQQPVELSTVAVGYDGEPESERALQFADDLAVAAGAELLIETVNRDPIPVLLHGEPSSPTLLAELREGAQLGALQTGQRAATRVAASVLVDAAVGEPGPVLRQVAERADLLVIGSRRWGAFARVVLGGAGETLVGDCGCSLVITGTSREHHGSAA